MSADPRRRLPAASRPPTYQSRGDIHCAHSSTTRRQPSRDADGTLIPLQSRVVQVAVDKAYGALPSRLHQYGLVVGQGADLLYVRFDREYYLTSLRPHLVRLVQVPDGF
ncbi:MAG: hypothetical protein ACRDRI_00920 [Pseudonocardiaceae bacterium]